MEEGATKIQAVFRGKQARKGTGGPGDTEKHEEQEAPADEGHADEIDIPDDEDTANAATRIQAKYRQREGSYSTWASVGHCRTLYRARRHNHI